MFFDILKKDLKRKRTMNVILLLFVVLSSMFTASGVSNVIAVLNGTEYYFDKAGLGDYVVLTMGETAHGALDDSLEGSDAVSDYRLEEVIFAAKGNFSSYGNEVETHNTALLQSIDASKLKFFDIDNNEITDIKKGECYTTGDFLSVNDLSIGDEIRIKHGKVDLTLKIAGRAKDAFLGSTFMGNTRFLLNDVDFNELLNDELLYKSYYGQVSEITDKISEYYGEKLMRLRTDFTIEKYDNLILRADKERLLEVLQNIIENAIKYGDEII